MKLSRRYQVKPTYWYCLRCPQNLAEHHDETEAEAAAHVLATGHEARVVIAQEIILRPDDLEPAGVRSRTS